ncbi:MAG: type II secretion system F family protein [Lachnospiraceae bacterium]|nr:type II secretion system F family protein [Lachnospiraceae bacterium]
MPEYKFKARDNKTGKIVTDVIQAVDEATFYRMLENRNMICISYVEKGNIDNVNIPYRFKMKELSVFCREFSIMMSAGIPVIEVFQKISAREKKPQKKRVYMYLIESVEKGNTVADTMKKLGNVFPPMLIEMFRIGEQSGSMEYVIAKMAVYYEKGYKTKSRVTSAMIYPVMLMLVTVGVVILLFTFVMPKFFQMFEGKEIPGITRFFMGVSTFLTTKWLYILIGILVLLMIWQVIVKNKAGRYAVDKLKCNIPVFSKLLEKSVISRFSSTMYILTSSGIVILNALEICGQTLTNTFQRGKLMTCREEVEKGRALSDSMESEQLFEDMVWSMIATGESTGNSDEMYQKLADYYEQEADNATEKLLAIMEPAMLVTIGVIVALVMASILIPLYGMYR